MAHQLLQMNGISSAKTTHVNGLSRLMIISHWLIISCVDIGGPAVYKISQNAGIFKHFPNYQLYFINIAHIGTYVALKKMIIR